MNVQLTADEDPVGTAREIFRSQIKSAITDLGNAGSRAEADIHGARKQLKRARATLRLLRASLGDDEYRKTNIEVRDASRPLSMLRDSEVLLDALDGVIKRYSDEGNDIHLHKLRASLKRERAHLRQTAADRKQLAAVQKALGPIGRRAQKWSLDASGWPMLEHGLTRIYRRARKAAATAQSSPTTENLHEWRKQVKYLWHQLQVLEPLSPGVIGELADEMHTLSSYLGDDHDLAVLHDKVAQAASALDEDSAEKLRGLIARRREELQGKAFALGERQYSEKPKQLASRFRGYWSAWKA
jgi:CHAD domain-containing protein